MKEKRLLTWTTSPTDWECDMMYESSSAGAVDPRTQSAQPLSMIAWGEKQGPGSD